MLGLTVIHAEAQRTLSIHPPSLIARPGDSFSLTVNIDDATGVAGFQFDLVYDFGLMTFAPPAQPGALIAAKGWSLQTNAIAPRRCGCSLTARTPPR
jgi:hypothetical protein